MNDDKNGSAGAAVPEPPLLTWQPLMLTGLAALKAAEVRDGYDCPRCGAGIPSDAARGKYSGALSRADGTTEICSRCGNDEALSHYYGWPWSRDLWLHPPNCLDGEAGSGARMDIREDIERILLAVRKFIAAAAGALTMRADADTVEPLDAPGEYLDALVGWHNELLAELAC